MSEKIIHTAVQLVNRHKKGLKTRIPAMSCSELNDLLLCIDLFSEPKEISRSDQKQLTH